MLNIQKLISQFNHYDYINPITYIIVHYVGANSTAKNNAVYFANGDRQASAHLFIDDNECWQSVEFDKGAWSIGNSVTAPNNLNSINVEMCLVDGQVTEKIEENTVEIVKYLMQKFGVPIENVRTHAEVTNYKKICPNWSNNSWERWNNFKSKLTGVTISNKPIASPIAPPISNPVGVGRILLLSASVSSWRVYPLNKAPVIANTCGVLNPNLYGGLSYEILGNPQKDVYTIQTQSFGKVNIYAPRDNDSNIVDKAPIIVKPPVQVSTTKYLNLAANEPSWRVYAIGSVCSVGNEVGKLAPATFGGLSYPILKDYGNGICEIQTQSFGRVQIVKCLGDGGSETTSPIY